MTRNSVPPLSSGAVDRDAATRTDPELLKAAWSDPEARVLVLRGSRIPVRGLRPESEPGALRADPGAPRLALTAVAGEFGDEHAYLGRLDGAPVFAEFAAAEDDARETDAPGDRSASVSWENPLELGILQSDGERELMTAALALAAWHRSAGFSPLDGRATRPSWGGWSRTDPDGALLFPRTDPAVIVLVEHEGRALLGSNALWETGRFSLLAGFVDAGESAEQAVVREIQEEAGVLVGDVRYIASQPWPFPRSLMLGFHASLASGFDPSDLAPDPEEISELRWFTRDELRDPPPGVRLPGPLSIARWLIDRWVEEG